MPLSILQQAAIHANTELRRITEERDNVDRKIKELLNRYPELRVYKGECMMALTKDQLMRLARLGATARLQQMREESAAIYAEFPDLAEPDNQRPKPRPAAPRRKNQARARKRPARARTHTPKRRQGGMSKAARKAVSERMRRYWAERRRAKANGGE